MSKVENKPEIIFHPSGMVREIIEDATLTDEKKKELIVSLGPEAGEFSQIDANK